MIAQNKVLVLDDDIDICNSMTDFLNGNNYNVRSCTNIKDFLENLSAFDPQFILIDKNVQKDDTYPLIDKIRHNSDKKDIPIIVVTGASGEGEQELAINVGADAIIFKPFRLTEVRAKLKSLSRRSSMYVEEGEKLLYRNIVVDLTSDEVFQEGQKLNLTSTEAKILKALILSKGSVLTRDSLDSKALTCRNNSPRTIDVHINSLRNKLGDLGSNIKTLRGRGYLLVQ